ncbi:hypothetical protein JKP88DRAFT_264288 [Tribonema minus]|uniref:Uncharacterized protein n=1 Tax=Tribonema minus TaxID=303371 RepID=A0A835YPY1_9STRA|nr:hypothetical protein JKP88DRAFT_264288 [Tribonema minus]
MPHFKHYSIVRYSAPSPPPPPPPRAYERYDPDGFDPERDTVGAGIYGGNVVRDVEGNIVVGRQYQDHNARPGPVYAGTGYSPMSNAIHRGPDAVKALLATDAALKEEISTGGARPLHICGMSKRGQHSAQVLIDAGADIHAFDSYGYTPLHRMASNNLAAGAEALLRAGADPLAKSAEPFPGKETPLEIAKASRACARRSSAEPPAEPLTPPPPATVLASSGGAAPLRDNAADTLRD